MLRDLGFKTCLMGTMKYWTCGTEAVSWFKETKTDKTGAYPNQFLQNLCKTRSSDRPSFCLDLKFCYNNVLEIPLCLLI